MAKNKRWNFYAVARGRKPGIYTNWTECYSQVNGFKGNYYKGFDTKAEAEAFIKENGTEPKHEKVNFKCAKKKTLEPRKATKVENVAKNVDNVLTKIKALDLNSKGGEVKTKLNTTEVREASDEDDDDDDDENDEKFKDYVNVHIDALLENKLNVGDSANFRIYWGKDHDYNLTKAKNEASEDDDNDGRAPRLSKLGKELVLLTETIRLAHDQEITKLRVHTYSIPLIHNIRYNIPYWKSEENKKKWKYEVHFKNKDPSDAYFDEFGEIQFHDAIKTIWKSIPFAMIKVIEDLDEALDESGIILALKLKRDNEKEKRNESTD